MGFVEEITKVKYPHGIKSIWHSTTDVKLHHLFKVGSARYSKVIFPFLSLFFVRVNKSSPHSRGKELSSTSWMGKYLHIFLELFCKEDFSSFSICLSIWSFVYFSLDSYLFYTLSYYPIWYYLLCCSNWSISDIGSSFRSGPVSFLHSFSTSLLWGTRCCRIISYYSFS